MAGALPCFRLYSYVWNIPYVQAWAFASSCRFFLLKKFSISDSCVLLPDDEFSLWISLYVQEIVSIYPVLSPPNLTPAQSNRVCNALALLQVHCCHLFNWYILSLFVHLYHEVLVIFHLMDILFIVYFFFCFILYFSSYCSVLRHTQTRGCISLMVNNFHPCTFKGLKFLYKHYYKQLTEAYSVMVY